MHIVTENALAVPAEIAQLVASQSTLLPPPVSIP